MVVAAAAVMAAAADATVIEPGSPRSEGTHSRPVPAAPDDPTGPFGQSDSGFPTGLLVFSGRPEAVVPGWGSTTNWASRICRVIKKAA